eukprot:gene13606-19481_t
MELNEALLQEAIKLVDSLLEEVKAGNPIPAWLPSLTSPPNDPWAKNESDQEDYTRLPMAPTSDYGHTVKGLSSEDANLFGNSGPTAYQRVGHGQPGISPHATAHVVSYAAAPLLPSKLAAESMTEARSAAHAAPHEASYGISASQVYPNTASAVYLNGLTPVVNGVFSESSVQQAYSPTGTALPQPEPPSPTTAYDSVARLQAGIHALYHDTSPLNSGSFADALQERRICEERGICEEKGISEEGMDSGSCAIYDMNGAAGMARTTSNESDTSYSYFKGGALKAIPPAALGTQPYQLSSEQDQKLKAAMEKRMEIMGSMTDITDVNPPMRRSMSTNGGTPPGSPRDSTLAPATSLDLGGGGKVVEEGKAAVKKPYVRVKNATREAAAAAAKKQSWGAGKSTASTIRLGVRLIQATSLSRTIESSACENVKHFTKAVMNSKDPFWDEFFVFEVKSPAFAVLKVTVKDHVHCWRPAILGELRIPVKTISDFQTKHATLSWYRLRSRNGKVQLQLFYLAERIHRPLNVMCCTWNVGNAEPCEDLRQWLDGADQLEHDIIAIGVQECSYKVKGNLSVIDDDPVMGNDVERQP